MTQAEKARKGLLTPVLKAVAKAEGIAPEKLAPLVADGFVVIPFNPRHSPGRPAGIGRGLRTKVNVNIGTSRDFPRLADELRKVRISLDYGADALMDLSTGGDLKKIRKTILARTPIPVGTVPIYQALLRGRFEGKGAISEMSPFPVASSAETTPPSPGLKQTLVAAKGLH